jgi:hypothetical protein
MDHAIHCYEAQGWQVEHVSVASPSDLRRTRPGGQVLRVEIMGTTGDGSKVLLNAGEARHVGGKAPDVALFIRVASNLAHGPEHALEATGGQETTYEPWMLDDENLAPLGDVHSPPGRSPIYP